MPIGGSTPNKTFTRQINAFTGSDSWEQLEASGRDILSADQDYEGNDIATAINACLFKNGDNFSADIPTSGQKFTGVGNATARTHFAAAGQVADSSLIYAGTSSGTDTITATLTPAITAYAAGQRYHFKAGGTNTGAATINFNSVGAASIKKGADGATALAAGDITADGLYTVEYDGTNFQLVNVRVTAASLGLVIGTDVQAHDDQLDDIAALAVTDGNFIVGDGANWVAESGATARTSLGIVAASDTAAGIIEIAVQSELEAASSTTLAVPPGRQHFHPGHPKAGGLFDGTGTAAFASGDYGMGAITDNGTGDYTLALDTAFANANYWITANTDQTATNNAGIFGEYPGGTRTSSALRVLTINGGNNANDRNDNSVAFWGDYA